MFKSLTFGFFACLPERDERCVVIMGEEYLVVSDPEVRGGKPVVRGTRVPVQYILELWNKGCSIDYIHEQYPTVQKDLIEKVIELMNKNRLIKISY